MQQNVRLYPHYQIGRNLLLWLPVFFLYLSERVGVRETLLLEAIYYLSVVVLEVPSGYFSDRIGRRLTLLIAGAAQAAACCVFALGSSFAPFAAAQVLLAVGMAFNSGTDSSLLYDSLAALGRGEEMGAQVARAQKRAFQVLAASTLAGGLLAGFDLRIAYALSALGGVLSFGVAWRFREPPRGEALAPRRQLGAAVAQLGDPVLRWLFLFAVVMTVFNHVPYEFFQKYLEFLFARHDLAGYAVTPAIAGATMAIGLLISAWASGKAMGLAERLGVPGALLSTLVLQSVIIVAMGAVLHPAVILLLLVRSVPRALTSPVTHATIHPRLPSGLRATYMSLQSLVGRLAFSGSLALAAWALPGERLTPAGMSALLLAFAAAALVCLALLALGGPGLARRLREQTPQ